MRNSGLLSCSRKKQVSATLTEMQREKKQKQNKFLYFPSQCTFLPNPVAAADALGGEAENKRRCCEADVQTHCGDGQVWMRPKAHVRCTDHCQPPCEGEQAQDTHRFVHVEGIVLRDELLPPFGKVGNDPFRVVFSSHCHVDVLRSIRSMQDQNICY
jgi:hypothetical protein